MTQHQRSVSRQVSSNQLLPHPKLEQIVKRHLHSEFKRPIAAHNQNVFESTLRHTENKKVIFDSGCGTGTSTLLIAKNNPAAVVIGIDKSAHRLSKNSVSEKQSDNALLVRADLIDFLRLAVKHNIKLYKHFILYPNPWPKKQHFIRRWHGSPVFTDILKLGGSLELRSNWPLYVTEFAQALLCAGQRADTFNVRDSMQPFISDFEAKYFNSGHQLIGLRAKLNVDSKAGANDN